MSAAAAKAVFIRVALRNLYSSAALASYSTMQHQSPAVLLPSSKKECSTGYAWKLVPVRAFHTMLGILACACCMFSFCFVNQEDMAVLLISEHCKYQQQTHHKLAKGSWCSQQSMMRLIALLQHKDFWWSSGDQGDVAVPSASKGSDMLRVSRLCSTLSISCVTHHESLSTSQQIIKSRPMPPHTLTCLILPGSAA